MYALLLGLLDHAYGRTDQGGILRSDQRWCRLQARQQRLVESRTRKRDALRLQGSLSRLRVVQLRVLLALLRRLLVVSVVQAAIRDGLCRRDVLDHYGPRECLL